MPRTPNKPLEALGGKKELSPMELEFMRFIWEHPDGVSSQEIYEHFQKARGTVSTVLYNISEAGYVDKRQDGRHHFYIALVTQEEYENAVFRQKFMREWDERTFERLAAAFCGRKTLTEMQKEKVQKLLEELKNDDHTGKPVD